jgi:hypothetical protein
MPKRPIILLLNIIAYLFVFQQLKHVYKDITGGFKETSGIVVSYGEGWSPSGGRASNNNVYDLIIKYGNGEILNGSIRSKEEIYIGDTLLFKYYGDSNPIFLKKNNKEIDVYFSDVIGYYLTYFLLYTYLFYFSIKPVFRKYFNK